MEKLREYFQKMSAAEFAALYPNTVYIKTIKDDKGTKTYAIHGTDGKYLAPAASFEIGTELARQYDCLSVNVH